MNCKNCSKEIIKVTTDGSGTEYWVPIGTDTNMFNLNVLDCIPGNSQIWHEPMPKIKNE